MTSYDDVVGWAAMIKEVVEQGRMPPWFADGRYGQFRNDARLNDQEKRQLCTWIENGCPKGDDRDLPEPRTFTEGWLMGTPDQVVYMSDKPFTVPATGTVDYQHYTVDPGWTTDKWIQCTEARPGNRAVVHHVQVYVEAKHVTDAIPGEHRVLRAGIHSEHLSARHSDVRSGGGEASLSTALHAQRHTAGGQEHGGDPVCRPAHCQ